VQTYAQALGALGDPRRRQIFELLRKGPTPVGTLAAELPISRPAVSQHLKVLEAAGLVRCRQAGTRRLYTVDPEGLEQLRSWLDGFWDDALARFRQAADEKGRRR
jgi:DNA-binding transcriptional ArsR family regulator